METLDQIEEKAILDNLDLEIKNSKDFTEKKRLLRIQHSLDQFNTACEKNDIKCIIETFGRTLALL